MRRPRRRDARYGRSVPELPEVETVRRGLAPWLDGRVVTDAWGDPSPKFVAASELIDHALGAVHRRGKYLLVDASHDGRPRELVIHLGMTGQLGADLDPDGPHTRAWWRMDDGTTLVFRDVRQFGRVSVVDAGDHAGLPTLAALGPEPFDPAFTGAALHRALAASRLRVKTHLLSQRPVAGVGNIYADEALWRAGVNPAARRVGPARAEALRDAIVDVLALGIANGGTTLRDYRGVDGSAGRNQSTLDCYGRTGQACNRCGDTLRHRVLDGRGTTWCPTCQSH